MNFPSASEFQQEFLTICSLLERRRQRYLRLFRTSLFFAVALLLIAIAFPDQILLGIDRFFQITKPLSHRDIHSFQLFLCICSVVIVLSPVFNYRGTNNTAALHTFRLHKFSLKDAAYSRLFKCFGPFEFAPRGGVSLVDIRKSLLFPHHQLYLPEDYVVGQCHDVTVKLCDTNIARVENRRKVSIFKGLLMVFDISTMGVKLRGPFKGHTVILNRLAEQTETPESQLPGLRRWPLPGAYGDILTGFTDGADEAARVMVEGLIADIANLMETARQLTQQKEHWDDKLAYAGEAFYDYLKEKCTSAFGNTELPAEKAYDAKYDTGLDLVKATAIDGSPAGLNQVFSLEYYDDKLVLLIPCPFDLFETESIFEPALKEEDGRFLYALMSCINRVAEHLNQVMP